jgi:hypothetical protein
MFGLKRNHLATLVGGRELSSAWNGIRIEKLFVCFVREKCCHWTMKVMLQKTKNTLMVVAAVDPSNFLRNILIIYKASLCPKQGCQIFLSTKKLEKYTK